MLLHETIPFSVLIHPSNMGRINNYTQTYLNSDEIIGKCILDRGYIVCINHIDRIVNQVIDRATSDIILKVFANVDIFKPMTGFVYDGIVNVVHPDGILVEIYKCQKVLIPLGKAFTTVGSCIKTRLTYVVFRDKKFTCLGEMVS